MRFVKRHYSGLPSMFIIIGIRIPPWLHNITINITNNTEHADRWIVGLRLRCLYEDCAEQETVGVIKMLQSSLLEHFNNSGQNGIDWLKSVKYCSTNSTTRFVITPQLSSLWPTRNKLDAFLEAVQLYYDKCKTPGIPWMSVSLQSPCWPQIDRNCTFTSTSKLELFVFPEYWEAR